MQISGVALIRVRAILLRNGRRMINVYCVAPNVFVVCVLCVCLHFPELRDCVMLYRPESRDRVYHPCEKFVLP